MEPSPFQQQQNMGAWYPHQYPPPSLPPQQHQQHQHQHHHQQQNEFHQLHQPPPPHHQPYQHPQPHAMAWSSAPLAPPGDQSFSYSQAPPYQQPQPGYYPHPQPQQQQVHHPYPSSQPQFTYAYGQQDQAWQASNNHNNPWRQQQWSYPAVNNNLSQEEVWAAKARAWAASKAVQDEPSPTPVATQPYPEYSQHKQDTQHSEAQQYQEPPDRNPPPRPLEHSSQKPSFEKPLSMLEPNIDGADQKSTLGPPGTGGLESVHQLPSQPESSQMFTQSTSHLLHQSQASPLSSQPRFSYSEKPVPQVYEHQQHQQQAQSYHPQLPQQLQPQYQPPIMVEPHEGEFGLSPASLPNWAPVGGPGMPFPPAMGPGTAQFDALHPHQMGLPLYGRPDAQGLGFPHFVGGVSPSLGPGSGPPLRPVFLPDTAYPDRPKKAAVPSWLREEIIKKKAAGLSGSVSGTGTGMILSDEHSRENDGESIVPSNQRLGIPHKVRSRSPGLSDDEEEDQEEEIEAARTAAINQEIKRLLTEVLLKVTGDIFEEIAQEVLDEDREEFVQDKDAVDPGRATVHPLAAPERDMPSLSSRVLVPSLKGQMTNDDDENRESSESSAPGGDVLGLGNYASDEDEEQKPEVTKSDEHLDGATETETEKNHKSGNLDVDSNQSILKGDSHTEIADVALQQSIAVDDVKHDLGLDSVKAEVEKTTDYEVGVGKKKRVRDQDGASSSELSTGGGAWNGQTSLVSEYHVAHNEGNTEAASLNLKDRSSAHVSKSTSVLDQEGLSSGREQGPSASKQIPDPLRKNESVHNDSSVTEKEKMGDGKELLVKGMDQSSKEKKRENGRESRGERAGDRHRDLSRDKRKERGRERMKSRDKEYDRDKRKHEKTERDEKKERVDKRERDGRPRTVEGIHKKVHYRSSSSGSASSSSSSDRSRGRMQISRSRRDHHSNLPSPLERSRNKRVSRSRSRSPHAKHIHRRDVPPHEKSRRDASRSPIQRRRHG